MNVYGIRAIYTFELARTLRTLSQSIAGPVISTSLYFIVFGSAIGSRVKEIEGISYGAFIVPGLVLLSILSESISNASFGIYMPKFAGTIYEVLSAPISALEIVAGRGPLNSGPQPSRRSHSSSVNSRERMRNRTPSGASTENPLPRPFTTSTVRWVWRQYSYCDTDIQNPIGSSPSTCRSPRWTSESPVRKSPSG